ncbi:MAG: FimD/PapC N-terminal domain-containing protein [Kluyvera sp.]|jgi:outer membrane usher protein|uniref:FimD/PapC N-terminal domain-containing protein n=1 Tax=Kluyvera sp. TaxID=1538228 RepID=UPI003F2BE5A9
MKLKLLAVLIGGFFIIPPTYAEYYFNPKFIGQDVADLSAFEKGDGIPPGHYTTDIYVNNALVQSNASVAFAINAHGNSEPLFNANSLISLGLKLDNNQVIDSSKEPTPSAFLQEMFPGSSDRI